MAIWVSILYETETWLPIIDRVLAGDEDARATMWLQVSYFVERLQRLPLGPLSSDDDVRRDIAIKVLDKLEANGQANLGEWRARQARAQDHASWWGLIRRIASRVAIDYCRTSKRNVARRGEHFVWVDVEPADPHVLAESFDHARAQRGEAQSSASELYELLREVQRRASRGPAPPRAPAITRRRPRIAT